MPYMCCGRGEKFTIFAAHMDTVFDDTKPFEIKKEGDIWTCPGIGDDTANMVILMLMAKYVIENRPKLSHNVLFCWDTGEEGLENLRGIRELMRREKDNTAEFITLDSVYTALICQAVGSVRYKITIQTKGGHSYRNFGHTNAIERAAALVQKLYSVTVPDIEGTHTTYNVGMISGGTSVNTIAQSASLMYEYRSDSEKCMQIMQQHLHRAIEEIKPGCESVTCQEIGRRPAGRERVNMTRQQELEHRCMEAAHEVLGKNMNIVCQPGSTDCNIPMSLGIPSVCTGGYIGGGAHTRHEWVDVSSMDTGLEIMLKFLAKT
jgi:acetylornithine deacetylase/succinyl-diaminopimelate desuccinylase-like protein